ncbi:MAG: hypothetical protein ACOVS5_09230 [Oligoflexus sp.]
MEFLHRVPSTDQKMPKELDLSFSDPLVPTLLDAQLLTLLDTLCAHRRSLLKAGLFATDWDKRARSNHGSLSSGTPQETYQGSVRC